MSNQSVVRLVLVLLLQLVALHMVAASICTDVATGDYTTCFARRTQCHFDLSINQCVDGRPATCAQYLSDVTGCNTNSTQCIVSPVSQQCVNRPPSCTTITTSASCSQRSDCRWRNGPSDCVSTSAGTCAAANQANGEVECVGAGCYWDPYLIQCYTSQAEAVALNPCSTWSSYPLPNTACEAHGCQLDPVSMTTCSEPGTYPGNASSVTTGFDVRFVNPHVTPNTLIFNVQVWIPNILSVWPAYWTYIMVSNGIAGVGAPSLLKPGECNNIKSFNYTGVKPPVYVPVTDPVGLQAYFNNWVNTNHTFSFPYSNLTFGATLYRILGDINVKNGTLDQSVSLSPNGDWVIHQLSMDLNKLVDKCGEFGATELFTTSNQIYTIPISVIRRDRNNMFIQTGSRFYINVALTGKVNSVTSTSRYNPVILQEEVTTDQPSCPANQARMFNTYQLQVQNVYSSGVFVGPRNVSDVNFTSPEVGNTLQNCYHEEVLSVERLYTVNSVSYTRVKTRTGCRPVDASGQSFNNCSFATALDKLRDLGSATGVYPSALDARHDLWMKIYACPTVSSSLNGWANCTLAQLNNNGYPDHFPITIRLTLFPDSIIDVSFDIYAGLLPSPFTTDLTQIQTLTQLPGSELVSTATYNTNLQWNGQFTFVIGMLAAEMRTLANLTIDTDTLFRLDPLDPNGSIIPGVSPLYISNIFQYMTYVPKNRMRDCTGAGCRNAPATANIFGYDSFSVPVMTLRSLLAANGYAVSLAYMYTLPQPFASGTMSPASAPHGKHLMDTNHQHHFKAMSVPPPAHTGSCQFRFIIDDSFNPYPPIYVGNQTSIVAQNSTEIITGYQVAIVLFVVEPNADYTNITKLALYTAEKLPIALAQTLGINEWQIINMNVRQSPPSNSIGAQSAHRQLLTATPRIPLYASFVVISTRNSTVTAESLVVKLISIMTLPTLKQNLLNVGLELDTSFPPTTVLVLVHATNNYMNYDHFNPVIITTAEETKSSTNATYWEIGFGVAAMVLFACLVCLMCFQTRAYARLPTHDDNGKTG